ncbi:MAG: PspC domain-containing protein [Actinomycetaceae bacterium]|nr:PspC domain-containing protein [Actinomycetaceae bacterium]
MKPRLTRSATDRYIGGVCGGIAQTYDLDPSLVRLIALLLLLLPGPGVLVYLIMWVIMPLGY